MSEVLVVIPARGGSKGLARKNLQDIGGTPLIGLAVLAALNARLVSRVVVSTDDADIAAAARKYGAGVIERPAAISGDTASSESALFHALDALDASEAYRPDIVALLQCTAPFTTPGDIDGTLKEVLEHGADSAFAAVPFHHFLWTTDDQGRAGGVNHDGGPRQRRQDMKPNYLEAGSVYAMRVNALRRDGHRFCGVTRMYKSDPARLLEIDDAGDLARARALWPLQESAAQQSRLPPVLSAIVFDFDGVFTDDGVYVAQDGTESVRCERGDGLGLERLRQLGIPMLVLSKERNPVVAARCAKLRLPCLQGIDDKLPSLRAWLAQEGLDEAGLIYAGNDINDEMCLRAAACAVGPSDAHPSVRDLLHIRLRAEGGRGAVRELCDLVADALRSGTMKIAGRKSDR